MNITILIRTTASPLPQYQQQFQPRSTVHNPWGTFNSHPVPMSPSIQGPYNNDSYSTYEHKFQFSSPMPHPVQERLGSYDARAFPTKEQNVAFEVPKASAISRKRGISDLRSSAEQSKPRKVSKTMLKHQVSRSSIRSTPGQPEVQPEWEMYKPYVHHICGRRFTTLDAVKGHHHSEEDGLGCWVRYGSKEKDKAW